MTHVKICGVTTVEDAKACADLGATAIGVNFVPSSPRRVTIERAREIAAAVKVLVVAVVADLSIPEMKQLVADTGVGCLQLHGSEPPEVLEPLLPHAYKAVRIATAEDAAYAATFPGEYLLVDAKVTGALGGTGHTFDWSLVVPLARARKLTLAGGLTPSNVAAAIAAVNPYCVDVASGVESSPGKKDHALVKAFMDAAQVRTNP